MVHETLVPPADSTGLSESQIDEFRTERDVLEALRRLGHGIRVVGIGPGPTLPSPRQSQEQFERQCRQMPLQRGTSPEEIAEAVRFILAAPALTGQMIALDGGQHLGWAQPSQRPPEE